MLMPVYNQRIQGGESTGASSCVRASQPGSSHRAFSPLGTLPATEANEDLSEAVMFADMSKDGRQDGCKELGRGRFKLSNLQPGISIMVIFVVTHPPPQTKSIEGSYTIHHHDLWLVLFVTK